MRLGDVDNEECDAASILLVELVESGNLPPKGRSSVAAKNQNNRLRLIQFGELHAGSFVQLHEGEVRSCIADSKRSRAGARPNCFKWKQQEWHRARYLGHHPAKRFRRLPHGPQDQACKSEVSDEDDHKNASQNLADARIWLG